MEKTKGEKSPWVKKKRKTGPKKKEKATFCQQKKKDLAESDKGSWFDQTPSTIAASVEERSTILGASSLKIKVNASAVCDEDSSSESGGSDEEKEECDTDGPKQWSIVDRDELNRQLAGRVTCCFCQSKGVNFEEVARTGLGAEWICRCRNPKCPSHEVVTPFHTTPKTSRFYDVNRELVLGLRLTGRGHSAAKRVLSVLNLPSPVNKDSWTNHTKALEQIANDLLEKELKNAAMEVKKFLQGEKEGMNIADMSEEQLADLVLDAGVSIDGSWNQRGWSARDGVVAVISVDTGKVLDVAFLSNSCTTCEQMKRKQQEGAISRMDYLGWVVSHEENCYHNHEGSSQSMEARGSCLLFGRSLDKHKLRYIPFVGDGDSKSYTEVCKMAPYGPAVYIPKEDCIAHVTKRMGTALRKLTTTHKGKRLEDGGTISGTGRLTVARIDTIQSFYGQAIRENKGDAKAMSRATHAILKHYSSTPEKPRHEDCPTGRNSWCSYNRDVATGEKTHVPIKNPLPESVVKLMQPIFDRIGSEEFLAGCEKCLDQNKNECLHHVIWGMAPKEQYTSQQEASLAVALGVLVFNNGLKDTVVKLLTAMDLPVNSSMLRELEMIDKKRMRESDYKTDPVTKKRRKKLKRDKCKKQDAFQHQEGVMYSSQGFYTN